MRARASVIALAALATCAACALPGCKDDPTGTIAVTVGEELDAFSRQPAPTTLVVESIDAEGKPTEIARTALPADEISLGDKERTEVGALRVRGLDAAGKVLLKGESLYLQFGALENSSFEVFVQRTGELARMPRAPGALDAPLVGLTVARYLIAASGPSMFLYDLLALKPLPGFPGFPRVPKSLATFGTAAIVIDDQGATTVDLSTATSTELAAPIGGTFAEIAGGLTTTAPDGSAYVVGGSRTTGGPTSRVLVIAKDGNVSFATLSTPREGACAAWVDGRGLVVYGGSATGAGAELVPVGSVQGTPLAYPPDAVKRCGATALDASHVLVAGGAGSATDVGGAAQAAVIDLACAAACKPAAWPGLLPLVRAEVFPLAVDAALVVGDDATGATRAFRATAVMGAQREVPLKAPRRNARMVALPIKGSVAIVGGGAPSIEQYLE